jgi:alkylhydroperoxidase family enzyme
MKGTVFDDSSCIAARAHSDSVSVRVRKGVRRHHASWRPSAGALHNARPRTAHLGAFSCWEPSRPGARLVRHREIVIDRTCARCGCAYEWGVHVAFFAARAALTTEQVAATWRTDANDSVWSDEERLLIRLVDELHDSANISESLWTALTATFSVDQILELIALVGFYHTVSFFANGLRLAPEPYAVSPPPD